MYIVMKKEQHIIGYDVSQKRGFAEEKKKKTIRIYMGRIGCARRIMSLIYLQYFILFLLFCHFLRDVMFLSSLHFWRPDKESHF